MPLKKLIEYIVKFILMIALSFSFAFPFTTTLGFKYTPLEVLGFVFVFLLAFSILLVNGIMTKISVISFIFGGLVFVVYSIFKKTFYRLIEPFIWLFYFVQGKENPNEYFAIIFTLLFAFAFSLIVYLFTVKKFNFYLLLLTGLSIFCVQWMLDYFVEDRAYISFYAFIVSILIYYLLHVYNRKWAQDSNDFVNPSAFIVFIAPIALLVLLLTVFIPVNSRPIEWKWLDDKIYYVMNFGSRAVKTQNIGYFDLSSTGFGNDSNKLGSNVIPDKTLVLKVKSPKTLYLKGRSSDQYTGYSWVNTNISYYELGNKNNKLNIDTFEYENGLFLLSDYYRKTLDYFEAPDVLKNLSKYTVEIQYENIYTYSLFAPLKTSNLHFPDSDENDIFVNAEGVLVARKLLGKGFSYAFNTYDINYGDKNFENLLRVSHKYLYGYYWEESINFLQNYLYEVFYSKYNWYEEQISINYNYLYERLLDSPNAEVMKERLTKYLINKINASKLSDEDKNNALNDVLLLISNIDSQHIYGNNQNLFEWILSLSSLMYHSNAIYSQYLDIPDTVPQRVKDLAYSITMNENNDYDKVKAIEEYLSKNYKYNLSPGDVPDGVDFVDYFLFERKEGYCTYFASAMAILTRCIGIPSRYVEGYLLPSATGKDKLYEVTNERAHAWVEVYFEGIGWIQFEPTANFSYNLYQAPISSTPQLQTPTPGSNSPTPSSNFTPRNTNNVQEQTETVKKQKPLNKKLVTAISIVVSIILLAALVVFLNILKRKKRITNISKLSPREAVLELYKYYLNLLYLQDADIKVGETPLDHAERLDSTGKFYPYKITEVTEIFVKARYSRDEVTIDDFNKVLEFYHPLLKSTKENIGGLKYILYMYVLFKF
ncbi:transglutaminase domain-containing protein [Acetivibrio clariflavus]|uniref:transglutaminase TgpA family protein n=1 Tax=Acetivibrio clariflavus TaxID=288965 RepID=UPI0031F4F87B